MIQISKPDFPIGKLLATPAALEALQEANVDVIELVERHIAKDWGDLSDEDKQANVRMLSTTTWTGNSSVRISISLKTA